MDDLFKENLDIADIYSQKMNFSGYATVFTSSKYFLLGLAGLLEAGNTLLLLLYIKVILL